MKAEETAKAVEELAATVTDETTEEDLDRIGEQVPLSRTYVLMPRGTLSVSRCASIGVGLGPSDL